jgi:hypothetical protein
MLRLCDESEGYRRLLPFVEELGMLPGVLAPPSAPSPVRMYASVVGRVLMAREPDAPVQRAAPVGTTVRFSRRDLARAREEATSLIRQSRYSQAAEVLTAVAAPATRVLGAADPEVLSLRFELANVRFDGGDYRGAAPLYRELAAEIGGRTGPEDGLALRCRLQEATCNALIGQTGRALEQLMSLLDDERRLYGSDDERVLELRKQIGLLQLGSGRQEEAATTLEALLADVERVRGNNHEAASKVRELLQGLDRPRRRGLA